MLQAGFLSVYLPIHFPLQDNASHLLLSQQVFDKGKNNVLLSVIRFLPQLQQIRFVAGKGIARWQWMTVFRELSHDYE